MLEKDRMRNFLEKLNTNAEYRSKFLDYPVETLIESGFDDIEPEFKKKIEDAVFYLKCDVKHIFAIPSESRDYLDLVGFGIHMRDEGPEIEIPPDTKVT